jgi:hypothetical protein
MAAYVHAARSSSSIDPIVIVLLIAGAGVIVFLAWYFSKAQRLKRKLRGTPVCSISRLTPDAPGRVVGTARAHGETLTAPLTARTCLYYLVEVKERRGKHWTTILTEARGVAFVLDDGTGRALVDPERAELALDFDRNDSSGTFQGASPAQEALLARHGRGSVGLIFNKSLRYREATIAVGERIAVLGHCERAPGAPGMAYGAQPTPLRLVGSLESPLIISDAPETTQPC